MLTFKKLAVADLTLLTKWLAEPHVLAWWHEALTVEEVYRKYVPGIEGGNPTYVFVIVNGAQAIGFIQWYRWADYPAHAMQLGAAADSAGIDLAIGDKDFIGRGIGTKAIRQFIREIIFRNPLINSVISDPEECNAQSIAAFKKAGFISGKLVQLSGETVLRRVVRFNRL